MLKKYPKIHNNKKVKKEAKKESTFKYDEINKENKAKN